MNKYFAIICFLLLYSNVLAVEDKIIDWLSGPNIQVNATIDIKDQYFECDANNNCPFPYEIGIVNNFVRLKWDHKERVVYNTGWKRRVVYEIQYFRRGTLLPLANDGVTGKSLEINFDPNNPYKDVDLASYFNQIPSKPYLNVGLKITSVLFTDLNNNPLNLNTIPIDVHLDLVMAY